MNKQELKTKMTDRIKGFSVAGLLELFNNTEKMGYSPNVILVREVLMDRLEALQPQAFEQWIETNDQTVFTR